MKRKDQNINSINKLGTNNIIVQYKNKYLISINIPYHKIKLDLIIKKINIGFSKGRAMP